ncbi:MAG: AAA family ATPase [Bacteroidales bacterium]|nr:AAA family ATPase [Bacteroidales bacterium]
MKTLQTEVGHQKATILYAEITGFDDLSQKIPFPEITQLMNKCYEIIGSVLSLYGGMIEKYSGCSITAAFGIPEFTEKTPANAVSSAMELQNKVDDLNQNTELPSLIGIKAGIQTGSVLVGKIGTGEKIQNSLMGETVTLASRICDIAETGQVLTCQETWESTKDKFEFLVLEPVPVKGTKKPLPVFEVKGRKKAPATIGLQSGRSINSEMVGRENEYRYLEKQFMQLINGRGSIIEITGKAGLGKSRLVAELKESELVKKVALFEGRAISNGRNMSFHPIIQIIKSWAGIAEADLHEESLKKLETSIRRVYPEAFDEIFPFVATMMGYRLDGKAKERMKGIEGEALENLILKNLRDLLSRAASLRPVVILIEDAHWCDISSVIFLESLVKLVRKHRIMFVVIYRPGYMETGERVSRYLKENLRDHCLSINIAPLSIDQSDELIKNLIHHASLPAEINQLIIERSAGNPFFIEEVIRSLIDEGMIEVKNNQFILTENIKYANIPESIDNVLLSRIDRLDEKTKELLKTASVIGRNFYYKVLEEAAATIGEVDHKLEYLKDVQLINERKKKDEVEFLFKHALAQQATYESIVEKTKKELHLKIALSIEKVFAGRIHEFYGMLAHHYSKAAQQEKAEEFLVKAGDESMKSGASSEAVNYLKQALEIYLQQNKTPDPQKVVDLEEQLSKAYYATGQYVEAIKYFDKIISYYFRPPPNSDLQRILGLSRNLVLLYNILYFYKFKPGASPGKIELKLFKIITHKTEALTTIDPRMVFFNSLDNLRFFRKNQFGDYEATLMLSSCTVFLYSGILFHLGRKIIEWGEKYIREEFNSGYLLGKFSQLMYVYYFGRKIDIEEEEKVLKYGLKIGDYWHITVFYLYCGFNMTEWGNDNLTKHFMKRLEQVSEAFENNYTVVQWHRLNGFYHIKFRKIDELLKISEDSVNLAKKTDHAMVLFMIYCFRSMALTFRKEYNEAEANLVEAEKLMKGLRIPLVITHYLIAKSYLEMEIIKKGGNEENHQEILLKTTLNLAKYAQKARANLTEAYRLRAVAYSIFNKPARAAKNFKRSIEAGTSYGGNLELSRTYFEIGKFLRDPKNKKDRLNGMNAAECLLKAKAMFEEMNLQWDMKEYEKYMGVNDSE